jgi:hypothetical protein
MTSATATETAVKPFDQLSRADVAWAGGKGANLGELSGVVFFARARDKLGSEAAGRHPG